jgi:hypothetical protein
MRTASALSVLALAASLALCGCVDASGPENQPPNGDGGVSGSISGNTTWTSNTHLSGYLSVPSGASLTIGKGVTLSFASGAALAVFEGGCLTAVGTAAQPIVLKAADAAAGWGGIRFEDDADDSGNKLAYCRIGGVAAYYAVSLDDSSFAEIDHCRVEGNGAGGVDAGRAATGSSVTDCSFGDNGDAGGTCYDLVYHGGVFIGTGNELGTSMNLDD